MDKTNKVRMKDVFPDGLILKWDDVYKPRYRIFTKHPKWPDKNIPDRCLASMTKEEGEAIISAVELHDQLCDEVERLKIQLMEDCTKIGTLEGVNDFNTTKIQQLESDRLKLEASNAALRDEVDRLKKAVDEYDKIVDKNSKNFSDLIDYSDKLEANNDTLKNEVERLKEHNYGLQVTNKTLEAQNAALRQQVDEAKKLIREAIKIRGNPYQPDGPSTEEQIEDELMYSRLQHWLNAAEPKSDSVSADIEGDDDV